MRNWISFVARSLKKKMLCSRRVEGAGLLYHGFQCLLVLSTTKKQRVMRASWETGFFQGLNWRKGWWWKEGRWAKLIFLGWWNVIIKPSPLKRRGAPHCSSSRPVQKWCHSRAMLVTWGHKGVCVAWPSSSRWWWSWSYAALSSFLIFSRSSHPRPVFIYILKRSLFLSGSLARILRFFIQRPISQDACMASSSSSHTHRSIESMSLLVSETRDEEEGETIRWLMWCALLLL